MKIPHYENSKVFIQDPADNVLLLTRAWMSIYRPGREDVAGGGLKVGEAPIAAAEREALEETGLHVSDIQFIGAYALTATILGVKAGCTTHFFKGRVGEVTPEVTLTGEHTASLWLPSVYLPERQLPRSHIEHAIIGGVV